MTDLITPFLNEFVDPDKQDKAKVDLENIMLITASESITSIFNQL